MEDGAELCVRAPGMLSRECEADIGGEADGL